MNDIILVDKNDKQIGTADKMGPHKKGILHRAFSVMLYDKGQKSVLLQKRAKGKYHSGGLWSNTCCSHPKPGETIIEAANRRLDEELGIKNVDLEEVGSFIYKHEFENGLTEHEYDHVVVGVYDRNDYNLNPDEATEIKFVSLDKVKDIADRTVWFDQMFDFVLAHCNESKGTISRLP